MTTQEALYHQEVLMLAYMYIHPHELQAINKNYFSNISTIQMYELLSANYKYNQNECVQAYQVIDAMVKNKRFQKLLDQTDLIDGVLSGREEYIVSESIFKGYVKGIKIFKEKQNNEKII